MTKSTHFTTSKFVFVAPLAQNNSGCECSTLCILDVGLVAGGIILGKPNAENLQETLLEPEDRSDSAYPDPKDL